MQIAIGLSELFGGLVAAIAPVALLDPRMSLERKAETAELAEHGGAFILERRSGSAPDTSARRRHRRRLLSVQPLVLFTRRLGSFCFNHCNVFLGLVLAPAFIERHPHHDRWMSCGSASTTCSSSARELRFASAPLSRRRWACPATRARQADRRGSTSAPVRPSRVCESG